MIVDIIKNAILKSIFYQSTNWMEVIQSKHNINKRQLEKYLNHLISEGLIHETPIFGKNFHADPNDVSYSYRMTTKGLIYIDKLNNIV